MYILYTNFTIYSIQEIAIDEIEKNNEFWKNKMEPLMTEFYMEHLLPEIINPQFSPKIIRHLLKYIWLCFVVFFIYYLTNSIRFRYSIIYQS